MKDFKSKYSDFIQRIKKLTFQLLKNDEQNNLIFENPVRLDNIDEKVVLILGLNPSGDSEDHEGFMQFIDNEELLKKHSSSKAHNERIFYPLYFKPNYELVKNLEPKMWWASNQDKIRNIEHYIVNVLKKSNEWNMLDQAIENEKLKVGPYLVFADIFNLHCTNSKEFIKQINENDVVIKKIMDSIFDYYDPTLVVVTNSFVSNLLLRIYGDNQVEKAEFTIDNRVIILSGFVSSGRLDVFNRTRLIADINKHRHLLNKTSV